MSVLKLNQKKPTGGTGGEVTWSDVTSKPSTFPPSTHTHPQSDITNLTTDLAAKQATLVSGTNIKTINSESLLGGGDIAIGGGSATQINASSGTITATAGKTMVIFGSGAYGNSNAAQTVTLNYNGSAVSSHQVRQAATTDRIGINLIAVVTTVASGAVSITTSGGALYSPKITYIIL
jgi:hypothetical protein